MSSDRESKSSSGFWEFLLSGLTGIGSGFVAAYATIRDRFHDDLRMSEGHILRDGKIVPISKAGPLTEEELKTYKKGFHEFFNEYEAQLHECTTNWWNAAQELKKKAEQAATPEEAAALKEQSKALYEKYRSHLHDTKTGHYREVERILERGGIPIDGWRGHTEGMVKRFKLMGTSRVDVAINAAITTGIAAGGTLMFFNGLHVRHKLDELSNKLDAQAQNQQSSRT